MVKQSQIREQNVWWEPKYQIEEAKWPKRFLFADLINEIKSRFIISILGLRRIGKSTLLRQIINHLIQEKNINPKRILYFSFDQAFISKDPDCLEDILEKYFRVILEERINNLKQPVYIFLDEIQYINYWQDYVKRYYDISSKIKFFITGSQSMILSDQSRESLAGRISEHYLPPLSFREFLNFSSQKENVINHIDDIFDIKNKFYKIEEENYLKGNKFEKQMRQYLLFGQFPEIIQESELNKQYKYIRDGVLGKILEKDIPSLYEIQKISNLKNIASTLIENSSSLFEVNNLSRDIGMSRITAENYIDYLEKFYLLNILYRHTKSKVKQGRLLKKSYSYTVNFFSCLLNIESDFYDKVPEVFGKIIENYIFNNLELMRRRLNYDLSFFRSGENEIDFILADFYQKKIMPIEVKFKSEIRYSDFAFLLKFCKKRKIKEGIIITKNLISEKEIEGINLRMIPYYFF